MFCFLAQCVALASLNAHAPQALVTAESLLGATVWAHAPFLGLQCDGDLTGWVRYLLSDPCFCWYVVYLHNVSLLLSACFVLKMSEVFWFCFFLMAVFECDICSVPLASFYCVCRSFFSVEETRLYTELGRSEKCWHMVQGFPGGTGFY